MPKRVNQNSLSHSMAVLPRSFRDILLLRPLSNESEKTDLGSSIHSDWPDQLRNPDNYKRASCAARGSQPFSKSQSRTTEASRSHDSVQALYIGQANNQSFFWSHAWNSIFWGFEGTWPKEDPVMEFAAGGWIVQALLVLFAVFGGERSKTGSFRRRSSRD
ncbi:uncharacterized protein RSE6_03736 [Rhynchosporium secalis]|uniref:Uncharacterized protein n=1 Tax=Rhynchosporium secalis TaxID=38038 RepID=A0A1E1M501_RHYSE|nr:uncharacterized protein RSE6_03736 [Rhynchosporium secalis]